MLTFTQDPVLPRQDILAAYESVCPGINLTVGYDKNLLDQARLGQEGSNCFTCQLTDDLTMIVLDPKFFKNTDAWFQQNVLRHEMVHARDLSEFAHNKQDPRYQLGANNLTWMEDWLSRSPRGFWSNYLEWHREYHMNVIERPVVEYFEDLYGRDYLNTVQASHSVVESFMSYTVSRKDVSRGWQRKAFRPVVEGLDSDFRNHLAKKFARHNFRGDVLADWGF
jgi:hypothetical protein